MTEKVQVKDALPSDVSALRIARVYAESLLQAVGSLEAGEKAVAELEEVVDLLRQAPQLTALFTSPIVPAEVKTAAIKKSLAVQASPLIGNFLLVLNAHGRFNLLKEIVQEARRMVDRRARRINVHVTSAAPLPKDQLQRITQQVRDAIQMEPILELSVDPEILGGFVFRAGDWKYDGSTRTQLKLIRDQIIARSSHEIQSGRDRFRTVT